MYLNIGIERGFRSVKASELVPDVSAADFMKRRSVSTTMLHHQVLDLRIPTVNFENSAGFAIQRPAFMPWRSEGFPGKIDHPEMTVSRLSNAVVAPEGIALSDNGSVILRESFDSNWQVQLHRQIAMHQMETFSLRSSIQVRTKLDGIYFYLDSQHIGHFGHFFMDNLTRMWGYLFCRDYLGMHNVKILTRLLTYEIKASLRALGIQASQIVELTEPVICEELIVATKALQMQDYVTPLYNPLMDRVSSAMSENITFPERLFISRRGNMLRRLVNEEEIEALFVSRGFTTMHPSEFGSFERQVSAFRQARFLAGISGTNMYCASFQKEAQGTMVLCSPQLIHYVDYFVNQGRLGPLSVYVGSEAESAEGYDPLNVNAPWEIKDLDRLMAALDDLIGGR